MSAVFLGIHGLLLGYIAWQVSTFDWSWVLNRTIERAGTSLQITAYLLLATALLVRGWIPVMLLIVVALIVEQRTASRGKSS
jgi:hypothetical protein